MSLGHTFIAARWIVCGMHRIRAAEAENSIPAPSHRDSKASISVSLLLALSIIILII